MIQSLRWLTAIVLCFSASSCSPDRETETSSQPTPEVSRETTIPKDFRVWMHRTECLGACPVYIVSIDASGLVEYEGRSNVTEKGQACWSIPRQSVVDLLAMCDEIGIFDMQMKCDVRTYDAPEVGIEVTRDGKTKLLWNDWGQSPGLHSDVDMHRTLDSFAAFIDRVSLVSERVRGSQK